MRKQLILPILFFGLYAVAQENRNFDGTANNTVHANWGAAENAFRNFVSNGFSDLISEPGGESRENPRVISNALGSQTVFNPNELGLSDFVWGWGQFIDHDINFNDDNSSEPNDIPVPNCDAMFDPLCSGTVEIRMFRSLSDPTTGTSIANPRKHINNITSYIDGSGVYGSSAARANWLRSYVDGKLKTSSGNLLPWNTVDGEFGSDVDLSAPFMVLDGFPLPEKYFVGGDIRINEQPGLTSFHTLWMREHNRLCDELKIDHPTWTDEDIFQRARKIVGALIEVVTFEQFLPAIGVNLNPYAGYDNAVDPSVLNVFSAAGYRFGHTMVNGRLVRYEENGDDWSFGAVDLRDAFFNPTIIMDEGGIAPIFRGLAAQEHQMVDPLIMDDIRNFLFGSPGAGGLDLLSINIERGRERGLPDYNTIREDLQLAPHPDFTSLSSDTTLNTALFNLYGDINNVDPWIGFMSEDHIANTIIGEGLEAILKLQFGFIRDGDRFYYENDPNFSISEVNELKNTRLSEIILRNTEIELLQENVFIAVPRNSLAVELFPFPEIKNISLKAYPNPIQKYFTLKIETSRPANATLRIMDVNAKLISEEKVFLSKGSNKLNFELNDRLANGLYVISLTSDNGKGQLKVIKQH